MCVYSKYPQGGHQFLGSENKGAVFGEARNCSDDGRMTHAQKDWLFLPSLSQSRNLAVIVMTIMYCGKNESSGLELDSHFVDEDHRWTMFMYLLLSLCLLHRQWQSSKEFIKSLLSQSYPSSGTLQRLSHVSSRESLTRLSTSIRNSMSTASRDPRSPRVAVPAITSSTCFAKADYIDKLSIEDITSLFTYAGSINQENFDRKEFLVDQTDVVRCIVTAVDLAVSLSRGSSAELNSSSNNQTEQPLQSSLGDMDALYFVAVTRVYAEWRNVRLVPSGHKKYALSMAMAYKDIMKNLAKIEYTVHSYLKGEQQLNSESKSSTPTFRQLLQYETDTNVHPSLPRLSDASAANGLLWVKRQLHYQTASLRNTLQVPIAFSSPKEAGISAYDEVYRDYHGWAVKQIFHHSFSGTPPLTKLWEQAIPPPAPVKNKSHIRNESNDSTTFPVPNRQLSDVSSDDSKQSREEQFDLLEALDNIGSHIIGEWEKFIGHFNCGDMDERKRRDNLIASRESLLNLNEKGTKNIFVSKTQKTNKREESCGADMNIDPIYQLKEQMFHHVASIESLLDDITGVIEEFNMNDPTKV